MFTVVRRQLSDGLEVAVEYIYIYTNICIEQKIIIRMASRIERASVCVVCVLV